MLFSFFRPKKFEPHFPIIPLYATEETARNLLTEFALVTEEDPESDATIVQKVLVAETKDTRIHIGIKDGRVRFANYLTDRFNNSEKAMAHKLAWFVNYYGGDNEFDEPGNTGYMILWRNPQRKILIIFGLHCGPVRVIDEDPSHWNDGDRE